METILFIDDNEEVVLLLKAYLEKCNYKVLTAHDGKSGIELLKQNVDKVNFLLIDFTMPGLTGPEVCEIIRKDLKLIDLPIIMMTAMKSTEDKMTGYHAGVDDYMIKPVDPVELVIKIELIFKKRDLNKNTWRENISSKSSIEVDQGSFTVKIKDKKINLSPLEFDLFNYLFEHSNNYVSSDLILENVFKYPPGTGSPDNVRPHIRNLRLKLEEDPANPKIITSLLKRGYMLNTNF
jgi:DNA-binding response OmpR family regulator